MMFEPDVTLTDYVVTAECFLFVYLLQVRAAGQPLKSRQRSLQFWFSLFFATAGVASFLGGTRQGFFPDLESPANQFLDVAAMVVIGLSSLAAWAFSARILFNRLVTRIVILLASISFILYLYCLLFISQSFLVAIVNYLPSAMFALLVFVLVGIRLRERAAWTGSLGILLVFVGAGVQQAQLSLHPIYFTYNSVYHVIQAVAMYLIFKVAIWIVGTPHFSPLLSLGHQPGTQDSA